MADSRIVLNGSNRGPVAGARLIGRTDAAAPVRVTVVLKRKVPIDSTTLDRHVALLPHERALADHATFAAQYGADDDAVSAVLRFAAAHGLAVSDVDKARRVVVLTGPVSAMEEAFGTELNDYQSERGTFRGRRGPILLPPDLQPFVEAVLGLDNRPVAKPRFRPRAAVSAGFTPQQVAALYDYPSSFDGTGETIAIIELGGNFDQGDLSTYFQGIGLTKQPTVKSISVSPNVPVAYGTDPADGEVMLDIEVSGAMAPGATIVVYFAENTDEGFYQAASQAVHDPATTVVSISWGSPEKDWSQQSMDSWNSLGQSATLLNVPIFVAAGDNGCTDEVPGDQGYDGQRHVDFPGTCANGVVSCGGTKLVASGGAIASETVWNESATNEGATGGGVSTYFPVPTWQNGLIAETTPLVMRGVPDISGVADPVTGYSVRVDHADQVIGGTSAVAPQWAALTAVLSESLGRKAGFFLPLLYANAAANATSDIVSGNNSIFGVTGYSAKPGWDACTGLGSPNGAKILSILTGAATTPPPTPSGNGSSGSPVTTLVPTGPPAGVASRSTQAFDPLVAAHYGDFVQAAYDMYGVDQKDLTPQPLSIPAGYRLAAWIQMQDFILGSVGLVFYGIVAQETANPSNFVVAIRGTGDGIEWWDDVTSVVKTVFKDPNCGSVGSGFARIYDTLEVVEVPSGAAGALVARSLKPVGGFSQQIADLVKRHATQSLSERVAGVPATASVVVTGHSLGAALATLYAIDNAVTDQISNPACVTFASPRVGDGNFVNAFNALDLTSWRIVNKPDKVPMLPPTICGFGDVDTLELYDSTGKVQANLGCWHSLATYLSLLDPSRQPNSSCALASAAAAVVERSLNGTTSLEVPAAGSTINITINLEAQGGDAPAGPNRRRIVSLRH